MEMMGPWDKEWQSWKFPLDVDHRGQSVWKKLTSVGTMGRKRKTVACRLGEAVEGASCWLWTRREELSQKPGQDGSSLPTRQLEYVVGSGSKHKRKVEHHLIQSHSHSHIYKITQQSFKPFVK